MFLTTGETTVKTHALCFVAVLLALPPFPNIASAQTTASAGVRVSGTVFDSISALQLRGASVQIVGAAGDIVGRRFTAISDSTGRYSIAGVPSGSYIAGFQHARLDSLGLEIEEQRLQVGESDLRFDLATPAPATYIALVCPDYPKGGLLVGHVRRTGTQAPLPNATVIALWSELDTSNVFSAQQNRDRAITTSSSGWFSLCGLPTEGAFLARAGSGSDSSGFVRLTTPTGTVKSKTFHIGGAERVVTKADSSADETSEVAWRGDAQLSGVVYDRHGQSLPNARLTLWGSASEATTDSRGRYRLGRLPGGTQTIEVRAIGFQPLEQAVDLSKDDPATVDLVLRTPVTELEGVKVTASPVRARLTPFYERMRDAERGINRGYFFTPEDLERRKPTLITNMLEGLPGIRVIRRTHDPRSAVIHGTLRYGGSYCVMTVYLDGIRVAGTAGGGNDPINILIDPTTIAAIEVYPRPTSAPPQYQSLNGTCGVVLMWTK